METLRAFLSGCMAFLSFSSPKGSAEALPEVFSPLQNLPAPSHTANTCRIRRLPTLPERLCEIAGPRLPPLSGTCYTRRAKAVADSNAAWERPPQRIISRGIRHQWPEAVRAIHLCA